jgi:3',5'-cyclic AMP phosphodiesterase CpdA
VNTRILHVSDLHVGARDDSVIGPALVSLTEQAEPDLVIASGDLTHRGRPDQHAAAAELLRSLGPPVLAVPGNHDIPYAFPARFTSPWRAFEHQWQTTEPEHIGSGAHIVGVNSVRPWRHQSGGVSDAQLERATGKLRAVAPGLLRVVVMHHQMIGAPWRSRKKPVARRNHVLAMLVDGGAELIVGGHIHQGTVSERHEFEAIDGDVRGAVISIAPGAGQPRPHRRGEARGCMLYRTTDTTITVDTHIWQGDGWELTAVRTFPRGREPLEVPSSS